MKKMRKIIPALAMLVLSAVMMSTASFAWFSMNTSVTATGMQVTASAGGDLLISRTSATTGFAATVSFSDVEDKNSLKPVSVSATSVSENDPTPEFYILSNKGEGMTADSYKAGTNATFALETTDGNYWKETVWVMSSGAAVNNLTAKIEVENGTGAHAMDKSLRVMIVVNSKAAFIYAPISGYTQKYQAITSNAGASTTDETITVATDSILDTIAKDGVAQLDIYIWYEGQDEACKSANAYSLQQTSFKVTFDAKSAAGN